MAARSGSLAWVVLAGGIALIIGGALWGLIDAAFVDELASTNSWSAPVDSIPAQGRNYVIAAWDWLLLIIVLRVGAEALVASRLTGASTSLLVGTMVVFFAHLLIVLWMLVFPEIGAEMFDIAMNSQEVQDAGYTSGVQLAWQWGVGVIPAVLLLITDVWYISAPIRNDLVRT